MKIKSTKAKLLQGIQAVQNAISLRTNLPVLSNILIEASKNLTRFIATDLDMGICFTTQLDTLEEGAVTLPAKRLGDIIREMPEEAITLWAKKNNITSIESGNCIFKLMGLPKEDFPKLPEFKDKKMIKIEQNNLKKMLNLTTFAVSHDEARYVLNGLLFLIKGDSLRIVATDGRRLALVEKEIPIDKRTQQSLIVPFKAVGELSRALSEQGQVGIVIGDNQVLFEIEGLNIISRLIEGEFPNYEQVIPKETKDKIHLPKERFLMAIKRASLLTTPDSQAIKIEVLKNKMIISKSSPELGESHEEVDVNYQGEELSVGFNPHYLMDVLKNLPSPDIEFELNGPDKPGVIRVKEDYDYIYIVLPMQIT
jgi:DNA polymerase-3 subunit beta